MSARTRPRSSRCRATRCRRTSRSSCSCSRRSAHDGQDAVLPPSLSRARLTHPIGSPAGRRQLVRAEYAVDAAGPVLTPVGGHGSHLIGDLASSNALVVVPEDVTSVAAGEQVTGAEARRGVLMGESPRLTHVDESGAARMVDVSGKDVTARVATASGRVFVSPEVVALLRGEGVPKGDALAVARIAGSWVRSTPTCCLCATRSRHRCRGRPRGDRRRRRDHRHRGDRTASDGGADRGLGRGAHRRRHGQGGRQGHRDHRHPGEAKSGAAPATGASGERARVVGLPSSSCTEAGPVDGMR